MCGMIRENSLEIGKIIRWKAQELLYGRTEDHILESIRMIRSKELGFLDGRMEENIMESGLMGYSTDMVNSRIVKGRLVTGSGNKGADLS